MPPSLASQCASLLGRSLDDVLAVTRPGDGVLPPNVWREVVEAAARQQALGTRHLPVLRSVLAQMEALNVARNPLREAGTVALAALLRRATAVDLSALPVSDGAVAALTASAPSTLRDVRIYGAELLTDSGMAALEGLQLTHLEVSMCPEVSDGAVARVVRTTGPSLVFLDVSWSTHVGDETLCAVAESCWALQSLFVGNLPAASDACVAGVAPACPALTHLDLSCRGNLSEETVRAFARHCPRLRLLNLSNCYSLPGGAMPPLCLLRELEELRFSGSVRLGNIALIQLAAATMARHGPGDGDTGLDPGSPTREGAGAGGTLSATTRAIQAARCQKGGGSAPAEAEAEGEGISRCLRVLDASYSRVRDAALAMLAPQLPRLRVLRLAGCAQLGDGGLAVLAVHCRALTELDVTDCESVVGKGVAELLARNDGSLRTLTVSGCARVGTAALAPLAAPRFAGLQSLAAAGTAVDDAVAAAAAAHCPALTAVDLSRTQMGSPGARALCALGRLRRLHLSGLACLSSADVTVAAAGSARTLEWLSASGTGIGGGELAAAVAGSPGLHFPALGYLALADCARLATGDVTACLAACPALRLLTTRDCPAVDGDAVAQTVLQRCPRMGTLSLSGGPPVSAPTVVALARSCRHLRALHLGASWGVGGAHDVVSAVRQRNGEVDAAAGRRGEAAQALAARLGDGSEPTAEALEEARAADESAGPAKKLVVWAGGRPLVGRASA